MSLNDSHSMTRKEQIDDAVNEAIIRTGMNIICTVVDNPKIFNDSIQGQEREISLAIQR